MQDASADIWGVFYTSPVITTSPVRLTTGKPGKMKVNTGSLQGEQDIGQAHIAMCITRPLCAMAAASDFFVGVFSCIFRPMADGWPGSAGRGRRRQAGVILRSGRALERNFIFRGRPPPAPAPEAIGGVVVNRCLQIAGTVGSGLGPAVAVGARRL